MIESALRSLQGPSPVRPAPPPRSLQERRPRRDQAPQTTTHRPEGRAPTKCMAMSPVDMMDDLPT
jgi:hypothetical protein